MRKGHGHEYQHEAIQHSHLSGRLGGRGSQRPRTPRLLEVIAIFFEAARARDYADRENSRSAEPASEPTEAPTRRSVEPTAATPELSSRQSAVLERCVRRWMSINRSRESRRSRRSGTDTARIASLGSALAGEETAHQNRPGRLGTSSRRLPGLVTDFWQRTGRSVRTV